MPRVWRTLLDLDRMTASSKEPLTASELMIKYKFFLKANNTLSLNVRPGKTHVVTCLGVNDRCWH